MRADLPTGTVTFLFTDVEGSTKLLHEHGDEYANLLAAHRASFAPLSPGTPESRWTRRVTRSSPRSRAPRMRVAAADEMP